MSLKMKLEDYLHVWQRLHKDALDACMACIDANSLAATEELKRSV